MAGGRAWGESVDEDHGQTLRVALNVFEEDRPKGFLAGIDRVPWQKRHDSDNRLPSESTCRLRADVLSRPLDWFFAGDSSCRPPDSRWSTCDMGVRRQVDETRPSHRPPIGFHYRGRYSV